MRILKVLLALTALFAVSCSSTRIRTPQGHELDLGRLMTHTAVDGLVLEIDEDGRLRKVVIQGYNSDQDKALDLARDAIDLAR